MLLYSLARVLHMLYYNINFNKMADTSKSTFFLNGNDKYRYILWYIIYCHTSLGPDPSPSPSHKIRAWTKSLSMLHSNGDFYHRMKCKCIFKRKKIWSLWVNSIAKDVINFRGVDFKKQLLWTVKLEC